MTDILNGEKRKGATIEGFVFVKKQGVWDGRFQRRDQNGHESAPFF